MAVVSIAIVISFHLKSEPTQFELRMAKPLGIVFWLLSLACLSAGLGNYIKTVNKYSRRAAIVQTGWKTQAVSQSFPEIKVELRNAEEILVADMLPLDFVHRCFQHCGCLLSLSCYEFEEVMKSRPLKRSLPNNGNGDITLR